MIPFLSEQKRYRTKQLISNLPAMYWHVNVNRALFDTSRLYNWNLTFHNQTKCERKKIFFNKDPEFKKETMNTMRKDDTVQAVLIADVYERNLQPFVNEGSTVSNFLFFIFVSQLLSDANIHETNAINSICSFHRVFYH